MPPFITLDLNSKRQIRKLLSLRPANPKTQTQSPATHRRMLVRSVARPQDEVEKAPSVEMPALHVGTPNPTDQVPKPKIHTT